MTTILVAVAGLLVCSGMAVLAAQGVALILRDEPDGAPGARARAILASVYERLDAANPPPLPLTAEQRTRPGWYQVAGARQRDGSAP